MPTIDLESQMALAQARDAQRRQAQQAQRTEKPDCPPTAPGGTGTKGATPAMTADASSARNDAAGQQWSDFRAMPTTNPGAPSLPTGSQEGTTPAASTAETPAATTTPTTDTPPTALQQTLSANPGIRTNQDLINHYYRQGGGTWQGASRLATADGLQLHQLTRNRAGLAGANTPSSPSTTTPSSPPSPSGPSTTPSPSQPPVTTTPGETPAPSSSSGGVQTYRPGSAEQIALFTEAGRRMGLSETEAARWASSPGLRNILERESGGQVGRPNYTYGERSRDPAQWGSVHDELRAGRKTERSSATGLGQLLLDNVERYYPSGRQGIGNPMEEAVGMMRYIQDRYGSPDAAWAQYGRRHEGY